MSKQQRAVRLSSGTAQLVGDDKVSLAEGVRGRVDKNFLHFIEAKGLKDVEIVDKLALLKIDPQRISKIRAGTVHVTMEMCVMLHYLYPDEIDLNEFIAGDSQEPFAIHAETPAKEMIVNSIIAMLNSSKEETAEILCRVAQSILHKMQEKIV